MSTPSRGELWLANLAPTRDGVASGPPTPRPVLVLSKDGARAGQGLVIVAPLMKSSLGSEAAVRVEARSLPQASWVRLDAMHAISTARLLRRLGEVRDVEMKEVERRIRSLFGV